MIRVLVVDDSAFMRKAISMMLEEDAEIRVVDTARDGLEAIEKVKRLCPDLVTMDIEMPRMDGITACRCAHGAERDRHQAAGELPEEGRRRCGFDDYGRRTRHHDPRRGRTRPHGEEQTPWHQRAG